MSSQQQKKGRVVTGTITDAVDGTPIIGANIMLKGSTTGVISDLDGNYSIQVTGGKSILVVTYIGYKKREVPVEDLGVINIKMSSDNEVLDEVVVIGSGTQKKVSVTGAISTVKGMELKAPSSSLTSSLAGRLAGVMVNTYSGEPGSASDFYIRGISTFGGRKTPLIRKRRLRQRVITAIYIKYYLLFWQSCQYKRRIFVTIVCHPPNLYPAR